MASETCGRVSVTMLWNTVSERRIVTPEIKRKAQGERGGKRKRKKKKKKEWTRDGGFI